MHVKKFQSYFIPYRIDYTASAECKTKNNYPTLYRKVGNALKHPKLHKPLQEMV